MDSTKFSPTLFMCLKRLASYRTDGCFFSIAGLGSSVRGLIEKVGWEGGALYRQTGTACQQRTNHCSCRADVNRSNGILIDLQLQSWHQTIMQETYFLQYCIVLNNNGRQEVSMLYVLCWSIVLHIHCQTIWYSLGYINLFSKTSSNQWGRGVIRKKVKKIFQR